MSAISDVGPWANCLGCPVTGTKVSSVSNVISIYKLLESQSSFLVNKEGTEEGISLCLALTEIGDVIEN